MPMNPYPAKSLPTTRPRGFTLIELIVTLAIFAILTSLAVPSFNRMVAANRMANQTNELVVALNAAKSEAITRGVGVTLRARQDASPNAFNLGWQVFTDADVNGAVGAPVTDVDGTVLRVNEAMAGAVTVTRSTRTGTSPNFTYPAATSGLATRQTITFSPRGGLANTTGPAYFRVCDNSSRSTPGRIVQVNMVGRISVDSTTEDCTT